MNKKDLYRDADELHAAIKQDVEAPAMQADELKEAQQTATLIQEDEE